MQMLKNGSLKATQKEIGIIQQAIELALEKATPRRATAKKVAKESGTSISMESLVAGKQTTKKSKKVDELSTEEMVGKYIHFVNRKKNTRKISAIQWKADVKAGGKYSGFKGVVSFKDGEKETKTFLYRKGGFISAYRG